MRVSLINCRKLVSQLKELRIHLSHDEASKGAREFVERHYPKLKKDNPDLPILIRECDGIQPRLWARYEKGKESSVPLTNQTADDILKQIEAVGR